MSKPFNVFNCSIQLFYKKNPYGNCVGSVVGTIRMKKISIYPAALLLQPFTIPAKSFQSRRKSHFKVNLFVPVCDTSTFTLTGGIFRQSQMAFTSSFLFHTFNFSLTHARQSRLWRRKTYSQQTHTQAKQVYPTGCVPDLDKGRAGQQALRAKLHGFNPIEGWPSISSVFQIVAENCLQLQEIKSRRDSFFSYDPAKLRDREKTGDWLNPVLFQI